MARRVLAWIEASAREDGVSFLGKENPQRVERVPEDTGLAGLRTSRIGFRPEGRAAGDAQTLAQAIAKRNHNPIEKAPDLELGTPPHKGGAGTKSDASSR